MGSTTLGPDAAVDHFDDAVAAPDQIHIGGFGVEIAGGLVRQYEIGIRGERAGHRRSSSP